MEKIKLQIEKEIRDTGYSISYRASLTGRVSWVKKTCAMPEIKSRKSLYIALHELGHIVNGCVRPVYVSEFLAEMYAHQRMRELGFRVPQSMTERAKRYVRSKIIRAERRGARSIDPKVRQWTNLLAINC